MTTSGPRPVMLPSTHPSVKRARETLIRALAGAKVEDAVALAVTYGLSLRIVLKLGKNSSVRVSLQLDEPSS